MPCSQKSQNLIRLSMERSANDPAAARAKQAAFFHRAFNGARVINMDVDDELVVFHGVPVGSTIIQMRPLNTRFA